MIESHLSLVLELLNDIVSISAALSFHSFGIYRNFYLLLIVAKFIHIVHSSVRLKIILKPEIWYNIYFCIIYVPAYLLNNNSYLILTSMLLMHFMSGTESSLSAS